MSSVLAQEQYKEINALLNPQQVRALRSEVNGILRQRSGGSFSSEQQKTLQNYYVRHVIAGMTRQEAMNDPQRFPLWRKYVVNDLFVLGETPEKHDWLRNLIYRYAGLVAQDKLYRPPSRYNAVLMLGELNEREMGRQGGDISPAVPLAAARKLLLKILSDPQESESMQVGAMIGLGRHAKLLAAAGQVDPELKQTLEGLLQQPDPSSGRSLDAHQWMQRIAVEAVGDIGQPASAKLLEPFVSNSSLPMSLRCAAAESLGRLDYRTAEGLDQIALTKGLGTLALTALREQITGLQRHMAENPTTGSESFIRRSPDEKAPEDPFVHQVRRQLLYQLGCIQQGLSGLQRANADAAAKQAMTSLQSEISAILKQLDSDEMQPKELFDKIGPPAMRLESAVKNV